MRLGTRWLTPGITLVVLLAMPHASLAYWDWIHELSGPSMMGVGWTCRLTQPALFKKHVENLSEYTVQTRDAHNVDFSRPLLLPLPDGRVLNVNAKPVTARSFTIEIPPADEGPVKAALTRVLYPGQLNVAAQAASLGEEPVTVTRAVSLSFDQCLRGTTSGRENIRNRSYWWIRLEAYAYKSIKHKDDPDGPAVFAATFGEMFEWSPSHPSVPGRKVAYFGAGFQCFRFWSADDQFDAFGRCAAKFRPFALRVNPPPGQRVLGFKALEMGVDARYFPRAFVPRDFGVDKDVPQREGGEWTVGAFFNVVVR